MYLRYIEVLQILHPLINCCHKNRQNNINAPIFFFNLEITVINIIILERNKQSCKTSALDKRTEHTKFAHQSRENTGEDKQCREIQNEEERGP